MEPFELNKAVKEISDSFATTRNTLETLHECKSQKERLEKLRDMCVEAGKTSDTFEEMKYFYSTMVTLDQNLALTGIEQVLIELKCHLMNKQ